MSFRSQGDFDVNLFAKTYFNGGGHKNAAGGFLTNKNMEDSINYFSEVLAEFCKEDFPIFLEFRRHCIF